MKKKEYESKILNFYGKNYALYLNNTLWIMSEKILRIFVNLFVSFWVVRYLGPANFGSLNFTLSIVGIFNVLALLGLEQIVIKELVKSPEESEKIIASSFILRVIGSFLMWIGIAITWPFLETSNTEFLMIFWLSIGSFFQCFGVFEFQFQALVKSKYSAWAQSGQVLIGSLAKIILILSQAELYLFSIVYSLEFLVQAFILFVLHWRYVGRFSLLKADTTVMKSMINESWPLVFAHLSVILYMRVDQIMLQQTLGSTANGFYSAAVRISESWYFIPTAISSSVFPRIIKAKEESVTSYYIKLKKLLLTNISISFLIAAVLAIISPWFLPLFFGEAYSESIPILIIHSWSGIFISIDIALHRWEVTEGKSKFVMKRTFLGLLINITLNFILIQDMGGTGCAIATLFSLFFSSFISFFTQKELTINLIKNERNF